MEQKSTITSGYGDQAMQSQPPFIALIGALGTGKTTLLGSTFANPPSADWQKILAECVALMNDSAPNKHTLHGAKIKGAKAVIPLPGSCLTCQTPQVIAAIIKRCLTDPRVKHADVQGILFEGKGSTPGDDTVRGLIRAGIRPAVITLVDCHYFSRNVKTFGNALNSQIAAATVAIGLTKIPSGVTEPDDERINEVLQHITRFRKPGIPLFIVNDKNTPLPAWVLERAWEVAGRPVEHHHHNHNCRGHHDDHDEENHDDHHTADYSFLLKPKISPNQVQEIFVHLGETIARAKCVMEGHHWNYQYGDWSKDYPDDQIPGPLMVYPPAGKVLNEAELAILATITLPPEKVEEVDLSTALRENMPYAEAITLVTEWETQMPAAPVLGEESGLVDPYPEQMDIVKELARKESISSDMLGPVIQRCIDYWLAVVPILKNQKNLHATADWALKWLDLAAAFGFWIPQQGNALRPESVMAAATCLPEIIFKGYGAFTEVPYALGGSSCRRFGRAVEVCIQHGATAGDFLEVALGCLDAAKVEFGESDEATTEWAKMVARLSRD